MKRLFVFGLVLAVLVLSLGFLPPRGGSVAQPIVTYDFLANAGSASWNKWTSAGASSITFKVDDTSFTAADGMAALVTAGVTMEDGAKYLPSLWIATPMEPGASGTAITGDYYNIYIPYNASLHITFGLSIGNTGETGIVSGVAFAETDPTKPVMELITETKDYDGSLRDVTVDLSSWGGKTGGFQLFVRTPHPDDVDGAIFTYAAIEVTPPPTTPPITIVPTVLHFFIGNTTYFVGTTPKVMDTAPVIVESRTFLPIRYVAEELGALVTWYDSERKVQIDFAGKKIELWIGKNSAAVDGVFVLIDPSNPNVIPFIQPPGRTMMPLRFISENLGSLVEWFNPIQEARVTYPHP